MKNLDRVNQEKITSSVRNLYEAKQAYERAKKYYESVRERESVNISNFMFTNCKEGENGFFVNLKDGIGYYDNPKKLRVLKIKPKKIHWSVEKLKVKLKKQIFDRVVEKKYVIVDYPRLVKYLKSCGVNPAVFKMYVEAEYKIDMQALEKEYSTGTLKMSEVAGCYKLEEGTAYIKLTEV